MADDEHLNALIGHIPTSRVTRPDLRCCCGRPDCGFLKHNCAALDDLEKEVHTAAQLGQALLIRHEQYMQDAERDRIEMSHKIEKLESDKRALEDRNAQTIKENRSLLDQLETLNTTVVDSEAHVKSLENTLLSTRQELRRLEGLASRTYDLETQLATLEQEQDLLQKTVAVTEAEERSAIQRWKKAERRLSSLHDQLERIEREAREERERHVEVLGRMERQRKVERELDTAASRLKAAAATTGTKNGSNVVSHFVKDILQDNANLQMGIMELREMLENSNDEVQALREQLLLHQPLESTGDGDGPQTLGAELAPKEAKEESEPAPLISQALHIHHHYHAPKKEPSRPKKKRTSLNSSLFTPPRSTHFSNPSRNLETASAILSQTAVTIPTPNTPNHRWSVQSAQMSDFAPSSVPSSPQSMYRSSALFDRGFDIDSSRPTSPGSSVDPMSPQFQPFRHRKRGSEASTRSFLPASNFQPDNVIHEEDDDVKEIEDLQTPSMPSLDDEATPSDLSRDSEYLPDVGDHDWNPKLRRSNSHESIISISGLDIHTLKSRPSQLTITGNSALLRPRSRIGTPVSSVSIDTVVAARPTLSRLGHDSTAHLRSNILQASNWDAHSINSSNSGGESSSPSLTGRLGGWVFGRWGVSPMKSSDNLREPRCLGQRTASTPIDPLRAAFGRSPGINQKGPIPGFVKKAERAPSRVMPVAVDHDALREVLAEEESST